jgi:hypothetical protein
VLLGTGDEVRVAGGDDEQANMKTRTNRIEAFSGTMPRGGPRLPEFSRTTAAAVAQAAPVSRLVDLANLGARLGIVTIAACSHQIEPARPSIKEVPAGSDGDLVPLVLGARVSLPTSWYARCSWPTLDRHGSTKREFGECNGRIYEIDVTCDAECELRLGDAVARNHLHVRVDSEATIVMEPLGTSPTSATITIATEDGSHTRRSPRYQPVITSDFEVECVYFHGPVPCDEGFMRRERPMMRVIPVLPDEVAATDRELSPGAIWVNGQRVDDDRFSPSDFLPRQRLRGVGSRFELISGWHYLEVVVNRAPNTIRKRVDVWVPSGIVVYR